MIVVSNSSPLISSARIGRLGILASLYERISVPSEFHREVIPPADPLLEQACQNLGAGERGAILLAKSLAADQVLLDEWYARRIAREAGLAIAGSLGVLEAAARRGMVPDVRNEYI